jgi:hypothetical protein
MRALARILVKEAVWLVIFSSDDVRTHLTSESTVRRDDPSTAQNGVFEERFEGVHTALQCGVFCELTMICHSRRSCPWGSEACWS